MIGLNASTRKHGHCREVTVWGGFDKRIRVNGSDVATGKHSRSVVER